ncbi:hypothetical protein M8J76_014406 [Diaphorina citri]|nr:hypothetical protein M8J75_012623 [Diaphorina citri]KAI5719765.1 hypothetical protein M8J76_014406 [Diaphorina citri]
MILASPARMSGTHWFLFIVIIAFIATAIWVFIYFLSVREALNFPVNWVFSELLNTVVFALLYLVVSIIQLNAWTGLYNPQFKDPNIAAGIFGIVNFLVYLVGSYLLYTDLKISRSVGAT